VRAQVGQSYASSVWTTLVAIRAAVRVLLAARPQLLLCNGPGTCLPLVVAAVLARALLGRPCRVVYVESVARVRSLSLTGVLLYRLRLADAFFVQWEALAAKHARARCLGRVM
jgi:beta-1,4-N-acetylglucosaminyltransferase